MRNDMLFIDGEQVDLDDDTKITLNIKSNLFTDLSKIVSNNSYTIKLPKTVRNQRIIQHADLPACSTDYSRKYHSGRYFRNGIEIIPNAKVVLISASDKIDVAMTWGNSVALSSMIEGDKKMIDLPHVSKGGPYVGPDYREWKNWGKNDEKVYPKIDYGFNDEEKNVWYHPVEFVDSIINRISKVYDINLIFPEDKRAWMSRLFVPLLTRNDSEIYSEQCAIEFSIAGIEFDEWVKQYSLYFEKNQSSNYYGRADSVKGTTTNAYCSHISNGKPKISGEIQVNIQANSTPSSVVLNVHKANFDGNGANIEVDSILELPPIDISLVSPGVYLAVFSFENEEASVLDNRFKEMWRSYMKFSFANIGGGTVTYAKGNIRVANIAEEVLMQKSIGNGNATDGRFWIVPNLPNIKQVDFVKTIASILGVFAVADNGNNITFVSMDTLIKNKSRALDWTRKVVASYTVNKPKSIEYRLDGFAQRNNYKWKEDSSVIGDFNSYLSVDDETLDQENDVVTLPFAPTDMYRSIAKIPLYSYNSDGKLQYDKVEPRLLLLVGLNGSFQGMDWKTLLNKNYISYQNTIRKPIIITEKIEISDVELRVIDVTVPVYLGQYGRYYAVINIKAEDTGICECKLLQLEI